MTKLIKSSFNEERLEAVRTASNIVRNHTTPNHDTTDTVGKHTFNMIAMCYEFFPDASHDLIKYIVYHDVPEYVMGDIPGNAKHQHPSLGNACSDVEAAVYDDLDIKIVLDEKEMARFEFLDRAEFILWCCDQYDMGLRGERFMSALKITHSNNMLLLTSSDRALAYAAAYVYETVGDRLGQ